MIDDGGLGFSLLTSSDKKLKPLTQKQRKLARSQVDLDSIDPLHLARYPQRLAKEQPQLVQTGQFEESKQDVLMEESIVIPGTHPIPISISGLGDDSFACIARRNIEFFRSKFDMLLQTK